MRKLHCDEQKDLLMQFHSINIKNRRQDKIDFQILHIKLDGALELILK